MVKFSGGFCRGYDKKSCQSRALCTVGGHIANLEFSGSFAFRNKCGSTAAVAVDNIDASHIHHGFCCFIHGKAHGSRNITPVVYKHNKRTVCFQSDGCTRSTANLRMILGIKDCAVLHKPSRTCDGVPFIAGERLITVSEFIRAVLILNEVAV